MKQLIAIILLVTVSVCSFAQDSTGKKAKDTVTKKAIVKPISDSVLYISNEDLKGIYRYISDRTSGTQYFEIFLVLDNAIRETKRKAEERFRKSSKPK